MKKGFTLIELLAVIVILAVIAVIAVPIVLNIINDSKESAILRSADFYLEGVETAIATSVLKGITINDGTYSIMQDGNLCIGTLNGATCTGEILKVEMNGEVPSSGTITITSGQVKDISLNLSDKVIIKNDKGELVFGESKKVKTLKDIAVVSNDLGVSSVHSCASSGTCEPGTAFAIKVNDTETYKFYVLSDDGTNVNLLMASDLMASEWIDETEYLAAGGTSFGGSPDLNAYGPLTALKKLKEKTSEWTNLGEYSYTLNYGKPMDLAGEGTYSGEYVQNVRTRLPKVADVQEFKEEDWLYENISYSSPEYGCKIYWLSDVEQSSPEFAKGLCYYVTSEGVVDKGTNPIICPDAYIWNSFGIRPVITITK